MYATSDAPLIRQNAKWLMDNKTCPYGSIGTKLWVRESFSKVKDGLYLYKANPEHGSMKWKPSIHMPKVAARIWLEITNVKVERLQDISEGDAVKEGVESWVDERLKSKPTYYKNYDTSDAESWYCSSPVTSFETLWEKINGLGSFTTNPWVWVVEFRRIQS